MFFEYGKQHWYLRHNWPTLQRVLSAIAELLVIIVSFHCTCAKNMLLRPNSKHIVCACRQCVWWKLGSSQLLENYTTDEWKSDTGNYFSGRMDSAHIPSLGILAKCFWGHSSNATTMSISNCSGCILFVYYCVFFPLSSVYNYVFFSAAYTFVMCQ